MIGSSSRVAWSRREGAALAVLYLDLDRFKEVNDTLGHAAGDRLLIGVTGRLRACVRETDTLARLGGDEFAIVQIGARQLADTEMLAQRLIDALDPGFDLDGNQVIVGVSVGIALRSMTDVMLSNVDAGVLLQEADMALYRAKEEGRGIYRFFAAEMNQKLLERRALEADILEAIGKDQFRLHYQPQLDLASRKIVGAEALLRWHHPLRGEISPEAFIPLAEETGLIARIGEWVLQEACRQAALWPDLALHRGQCLTGAVPSRLASSIRSNACSSNPDWRRQDWKSRSPKVSCCTKPTKRLPRCTGCAGWASRSPWTISAPAILPLATCRSSASTRSRSTARSSRTCRPMATVRRSCVRCSG